MGGIYYLYNIKGQNFVNEILEEPVMSTGVIKSIVFKAKKGYYIEYDFNINGGMLSSSTYRSDIGSIRNIIVNKSFPVIYNKRHNDKNEILFLPEDFKEFKMPYPDSLKWITEHR